MSGMRKARIRRLADLLDRLDQGEQVLLPGCLRVDGFYVWDPWRQERRGLVEGGEDRTLADVPALVCAIWSKIEGDANRDFAQAAKGLGLSRAAFLPLVVPGNVFWRAGTALSAGDVAAACRYIASLSDKVLREYVREGADTWRRRLWAKGFGRGYVRLKEMNRAALDEHGIDLPVAFVKWLARQGHIDPVVKRELSHPDWGSVSVKFYDLPALAAAAREDPERFERLRSEYAERRARRRVLAASRPTMGPVVAGRYYTNDGPRPFKWGVLTDGWIQLPGGVRRKESGRMVKAWPVLQGGKPVFAEIPPSSGAADPPFRLADPVYIIWYRDMECRQPCASEHADHVRWEQERYWYWHPATRRMRPLAWQASYIGDGHEVEFGLSMTRIEAIAFWAAYQEAAAVDPSIWTPPGAAARLADLRESERWVTGTDIARERAE